MSLTIAGPNGPAIIGVSNCTLLLPGTEAEAIGVSAAHPPTFNNGAGTRTMTIDFHGDCCIPELIGCTNCGCHACVEFHLTLLDQSASNYIPPAMARREQNIPCRKVAMAEMPDRGKVLFSLSVQAAIHFGKNYSLYVAYSPGTCANPTGGGFARTLPFWVPGS